MALIGSLAKQQVAVIISLFGQHQSIRARLVSYEKPFIELEVGSLCGKVRRIFNENAVKEIIPI